jgi:hypothetical protein
VSAALALALLAACAGRREASPAPVEPARESCEELAAVRAEALGGGAETIRGAVGWTLFAALYSGIGIVVLPLLLPVVTVLGGLADSGRDAGLRREARARETAACLERGGATDAELVSGYAHLGQVRWQDGRPAEAAQARARAAEILARAAPPHPDLGPVILALAEVEVLLGLPAEAESRHRQALALAEAAGSAVHPAVAERLDGYARFLRAQGRPAEAGAAEARAGSIRGLLERVLTPVEVDLGEVPLAARAAGTLRLENVLPVSLRVLGIELESGGPAWRLADPEACPPVLAPGAGCTVLVVFEPTEEGASLARLAVRTVEAGVLHAWPRGRGVAGGAGPAGPAG